MKRPVCLLIIPVSEVNIWLEANILVTGCTIGAAGSEATLYIPLAGSQYLGR